MNEILVALDVDSRARALSLADELHDVVGGFKVGNRLFTSEGPDLVRTLVDKGCRVFLDLKYHDIPNTVAQAIEAAVATGVWMVNLHTCGGAAMMQAAARAGVDTAHRLGTTPPLVIGVTVLTSMNDAALQDVGVVRPLLEQVVHLAVLAKNSGLHGVVASPLETPAIRRACGPDFLIVTPGIRGASAGTEQNDQVRTMGPAEAVAAGANYLVVGRPIIAAGNPRDAALRIGDELLAHRRS